MKKTLIFAMGMALTTLFAFKTMYDAKKNTAEVMQIEGIYIFTDSKPVMEYEYLGTIETSVLGMCNQYNCLRDKAITKTKKEYPASEGIIISFNKEKGNAKCDVIKFK